VADVVLDGVSKRFGHTQAVADLTLRVPDGEFIVLLGPTGAGKTTTLRLVAGLEQPDAGKVRMGARDITAEPPAARDVAFVFQQYSLYPHLSVYDNLAFPLRSPARRVPEDQIRARVREIAGLLRLEEKLEQRVTQLSGGQMQRVAIGRALVRSPSIYLMDEPLSSLDAKLRAELRVELKRIQRELGATILYVTHDQTEAMTMASRIGVLEQGRLVQLGSPREIYEDPVNIHVATRLGSPSVNLVPRGLFPSLKAPRETATIGVRTEHVRISKNTTWDRAVGPKERTEGPKERTKGRNGSAVGRIRWIEHLGSQSHLHVTIADTEMITLADPHSGLAVGDEVEIEMMAPLFFDTRGDRVRWPEEAP
jgi:multiple sugar transport system ATP-binding protein